MPADREAEHARLLLGLARSRTDLDGVLLFVDRLQAELARVTRERDAAICRQIHPGGDGQWWYVADGVRVEDGERLGPFCGEDEAFEAVLAWIKWALDPSTVPVPEYRSIDEDEAT